LVPSLPVINKTPEELSLAAKPKWLDPDYEDDDDAPWKLLAADRETSEILIGGS
jgi:hypothetical protein